jgi:hypothetical protein
MKTSRLNYTFNAEEVVDKLRPYVTEVKETKGLGLNSIDEHTYTGFYKGKPVFQVTNKIHILRWGSPEFFHTDTKSVDKAIPIINEAVLFLKFLIERKRIEKANEDFK